MNSILVATIVFAASFGGALLGMLVQRLVPKSHLLPESKEIIRLGTGLIATMAALVLGLLVSAAKSSFDQKTGGFRQLALNIVLLDRTLAQFGEEAQPAREQLKRTVSQTIDSLWPQKPVQSLRIDDARITAEGSVLSAELRKLEAKNEVQRLAQVQAQQLSSELMKERWKLSQTDEGSLPTPFLCVLAFWLFVLFASFGLFSPVNALTIGALLICALSVAGAVLLIVDLDQPFDGLVKVSSASLEDAFSKLGQ